MSQFKLDLKEFKKLLYSGEQAMAQEKILMLKPQSKTELRIVEHQKAILEMRQCEFDQAIQIIKNAIDNYGNNLGLLIDLACSYYLSGRFSLWKQTLHQAVSEMQMAEEFLSEERRVSCWLALGKFIEEDGELNFAVETYLRALKICSNRLSEDFFQQHLWRLKSQLLRLSGQYGLNLDQNEIYSELSQYSFRDGDHDLDFEVGHSLMIYETNIFGFEMGKARLEILLKNPICRTPEVELIYLDLITYFFRNQFEVPDEIQKALNNLKRPSIYSRTLGTLINKGQLTLGEILPLKSMLPLSPFLRLVDLTLRRSKHRGPLAELAMGVLRSLSREDQIRWIDYLELRTVSAEQELRIDVEKNEVSYNEKTLDLGKSESAREILALMNREERALGVNEIFQALWPHLEMNEVNLSKLRMRVMRLNKLFRETLSLPKTLEMKEGKLCFTLPVKFNSRALRQTGS